jgi:hypothetical protein
MHRVLIVGVERDVEPLIADRLNCPYVYAETLPPIRVADGELFVQRTGGVARGSFLPVTHVLYHGIYEDDLEFITALALWRGHCLPAGPAMLKARPRVPCLVHALDVTAFPGGPRGYAFGGVTITSTSPRVAKFGQMHCGEGKDRFTGPRVCDVPTLVEPFVDGRAVRIMCIGDRAWQIRLEGDDWKKSIHAATSAFEPPRDDLVGDTRRLMQHFGLEIAGVDYMIGADGVPVLLEVNHIPNVDRFDEIRDAYVEYALRWLADRGVELKK